MADILDFEACDGIEVNGVIEAGVDLGRACTNLVQKAAGGGGESKLKRGINK